MTTDNGKATEAFEGVAPEAGEQSRAPRPSSEEPEELALPGSEESVDGEIVDETDTETETGAVPAEAPAAAGSAPEDLAAKYLALAQRTQADFENFRKRAARDAAAAQTRGIVRLAKELLPAIDDLDRALAAAESLAAAGTVADGADNPLVEGIKLVHADMVAALARVGIEGFSPHGERFDPQHHEAMAQQPVAGAEPGTIVEVYQRGYALGDTVIRPARVVVAG